MAKTLNEMPPLPDTLEACHKSMESIWNYLQASQLFVGGERWTDGYWTYEADGKLFLVPAFKKGLKIACVSWDKGVIFCGIVGENDQEERGHALGSEIL